MRARVHEGCARKRGSDHHFLPHHNSPFSSPSNALHAYYLTCAREYMKGAWEAGEAPTIFLARHNSPFSSTSNAFHAYELICVLDCMKGARVVFLQAIIPFQYLSPILVDMRAEYMQGARKRLSAHRVLAPYNFTFFPLKHLPRVQATTIYQSN